MIFYGGIDNNIRKAYNIGDREILNLSGFEYK